MRHTGRRKVEIDVPSDSSGARKFVVVTDSTADIDARIAAEHGITVVPLSVSFGDEVFVDGQLSQQEFFDRMNAASKLPTTSQPPIGPFVEVYERALETADHVLSVHISSKLSGTFESARQAAEQFTGRVHVFDSRNLSWGLAWQALDAAQAAADGLGPEAAIARLERLRDRIRLIVGLDSLDNLARGGRIGRVGAFMGAMLNLKVTLTVDANGEFVPLERNRGEAAALRHTLAWVTEQMGTSTSGKFAIGHALSLKRAQGLADEIRARFSATELVIYETGSVIATHTGTGWGVAVVPDE